MPEQIVFYHDAVKISPFCQRVEIALLESGASYTAHGFNVYSKPAWFAQLNPVTGKIPVITYGGPVVHPEEPSPLSFKVLESVLILEFLADIFPDSKLLPPVSNPIARARVRFFIDTVTHALDAPMLDFLLKGNSEAQGKIVEGLEWIQTLLPDPDAVDGGEFALGKDFTNADCAVLPILVVFELIARTDLGKFKPGEGKELGEVLASEKFERLRRYRNALSARESVKKVIDIDRIEGVWRTQFARN